jgi:hypothetical protein
MTSYKFVYRLWWKQHTEAYTIPSDAKAVAQGKDDKKTLIKDGEIWSLKSIATDKGKIILENN